MDKRELGGSTGREVIAVYGRPPIVSSLITRATMFETLLAADPSFQTGWDAFEEEWADEREPPLYLALSSLAEHLHDRLGRGDSIGFERVFAVVEQWQVHGDAYVREAASMGLLESLQNALGGKDRTQRRRDGVSAADIEAWLGPETRRWWDKLYRFWDGDTTALHEES